MGDKEGTHPTIARFGFKIEQALLEDPHEVAGRNRLPKDRVALLAAVRLSRGGGVGEGAFVGEREGGMDVACARGEASVLARRRAIVCESSKPPSLLPPCSPLPAVQQHLLPSLDSSRTPFHSPTVPAEVWRVHTSSPPKSSRLLTSSHQSPPRSSLPAILCSVFLQSLCCPPESANVPLSMRWE